MNEQYLLELRAELWVETFSAAFQQDTWNLAQAIQNANDAVDAFDDRFLEDEEEIDFEEPAFEFDHCGDPDCFFCLFQNMDMKESPVLTE